MSDQSEHCCSRDKSKIFFALTAGLAVIESVVDVVVDRVGGAFRSRGSHRPQSGDRAEQFDDNLPDRARVGGPGVESTSAG